MDDERPDYLPAEVWRFYGELRARGAIEAPAYRVPVRRLLGLDPEAPDGMARTWRALQRQIAAAGRPAWADSDWRLLFDLLWTLPGSFDGGAHRARQRAEALAPEIADLAFRLAERLREFAELTEGHALSFPPAALDGFELIEQAGLNQEPRRALSFESRFLQWCADSVHGRADMNHLPAPARLVEELGIAFDGFEPRASVTFADHANAAEVSRQTALVNHFDDRWARVQGRGRPDLAPPVVMAARFEIGATDLGRILSALFGFEVSREAVRYARGERAKNRKD